MKFRSAILVMSMLLLTACAATIKKDATDAAIKLPRGASSKLVLNVGGTTASLNSSDWEAFKLEWKEKFAEQAKLAGTAFEMQDGPAKPTGQNGTLLSVYVEDYRFMRPGVRYAVGVFGGNAFIESKLTFSDLKSGVAYGSQTANTSSSAWQGVFSAMTNKQVEAIAASVFKQLNESNTSTR